MAVQLDKADQTPAVFEWDTDVRSQFLPLNQFPKQSILCIQRFFYSIEHRIRLFEISVHSRIYCPGSISFLHLPEKDTIPCEIGRKDRVSVQFQNRQ